MVGGNIAEDLLAAFLVGGEQRRAHNAAHLATTNTPVTVSNWHVYPLSLSFSHSLSSLSPPVSLRLTFNHPPSHSLTRPLAHSPTRPLAHALTRSPTHPPTHKLIHSLTHSLTHPLTHSLTHSPRKNLHCCVADSVCPCFRVSLATPQSSRSTTYHEAGFPGYIS